jgi:hypothetical protein
VWGPVILRVMPLCLHAQSPDEEEAYSRTISVYYRTTVEPHIVGKSDFEYLPGAVALISPVAISLSSKYTIGSKLVAISKHVKVGPSLCYIL